MAVMNVAKFERFFRAAAGLDIDKGDLPINDFVQLLLEGLNDAEFLLRNRAHLTSEA